MTFAIPPTQLIQLDIDPREIGKNYPVEVALVGDAKAGLADLLAALGPGGGRAVYRGHAVRRARSQRRKAAWFEQVEIKSGSTATPMTMARAVREIQAATRDDAIVVTGAGLPQGMVKQRWVTRAAADAHHVGRLLDDGLRASGGDRRPAGDARATGPLDLAATASFLQSMQELQTAVLAGTPVCAIVLDNSGWISIKGGQETFFGRSAWTDFLTPDGSLYSPDFDDDRTRPSASTASASTTRRRSRPRSVGHWRPVARRWSTSRSTATSSRRRTRQDGLVGRPEPGIPSPSSTRAGRPGSAEEQHR